jgi:branched-chain amino acid transport system permease protein
MEYLASVLSHLCLYAIFLVGIGRIVLAFSSVWSIGHVAFWGIGGFITALLCVDAGLSPWVSLLLGCLAAAIASACIGATSLRLEGDYFVVLSVSASELVRVLVISLKGPGGMSGVARPSLFGLSTENDWTFLGFVLLPALSILLGVITYAERGHLRRLTTMAKESELFAITMGYSPVRYKMAVFVVGSVVAALAGGLHAFFIRGTDPSTLTIYQAVLLFAIALVTARESSLGVLLGATLYVAAPRILERLIVMPGASMFSFNLVQLAYGVLLLATTILLVRKRVLQS